jgi:hypothetical protein
VKLPDARIACREIGWGEGRRRRESGEKLDSESIGHLALAKIERDAK